MRGIAPRTVNMKRLTVVSLTRPLGTSKQKELKFSPGSTFPSFLREASKKRKRVGFLFSYEFLRGEVSAGSKRVYPRVSCSFFPCFSRVRSLNRAYINRHDKFSVNPR